MIKILTDEKMLGNSEGKKLYIVTTVATEHPEETAVEFFRADDDEDLYEEVLKSFVYADEDRLLMSPEELETYKGLHGKFDEDFGTSVLWKEIGTVEE